MRSNATQNNQSKLIIIAKKSLIWLLECRKKHWIDNWKLDCWKRWNEFPWLAGYARKITGQVSKRLIYAQLDYFHTSDAYLLGPLNVYNCIKSIHMHIQNRGARDILLSTQQHARRHWPADNQLNPLYKSAQHSRSQTHSNISITALAAAPATNANIPPALLEDIYTLYTPLTVNL